MTQKRKTKKKTGIPKKDYDQLNFFYKLYYYFMCFFNEAYCPKEPKYWKQTNGIAAEQTKQNRVNDGVTNPELDNLLGTLPTGNINSNGYNANSNGNNNSGDTIYKGIRATRRQRNEPAGSRIDLGPRPHDRISKQNRPKNN